ncbi:MAG: efflux RND transporter periplasmic adaptor subunit [Hyphomicrobiaceae bacterium]|nr:efflux RND transporter periplasmic adaptor subunit [Hyphomicrobiaceae bacterium]
MRKLIMGAGLAAALIAVGIYAGLVPAGWLGKSAARAERTIAAAEPPPPVVTASRVVMAEFRDTVLVTGSLVPREEILVGPEVEGLRVLEILVEDGDTVKKGQVLARLVSTALAAQLAQNAAALAKADAAIAQARSQIVQAQATLAEAKAAFERAKPLRKSGYLAESVYDQRQAAARTAAARLVAARDGLALAEAEKTQIEAQRKELSWRLAKTEVQAPADGVVSRRTVRIGAVASAAGEPMFRVIADGMIELDAEVTETRMPALAADQPARIDVPGVGWVEGRVRLVASEVDKTTRLGRVRITLKQDARLRIGTFASGEITTRTSRGLSVPRSAVLDRPDGAVVQVVIGDKVVTRKVVTGLGTGDRIEIKSGLALGDVVVTKAGSFLRDGDAVKPVLETAPRTSGVF